MNIPDYQDVLAAQERIGKAVVHTPLLRNALLDERLGGHIYFKPEYLQRTGSFKFRGAYNAISALGKRAKEHGVIGCSSGNHAQGLAEAARLFGVKATIVMPLDAPAIKIERTRRSGAEIVTYDRSTGDREAITNDIAARTGALPVQPFENEFVIAGQGTSGLELVNDLKVIDTGLDMVLVPTGGGGLIAGISLAVGEHYPDAEIYAVEPEGFDDYTRSLRAGGLVANENHRGSLCDALLSEQPGKTGFSIAQERVKDGIVVSDREALDAVAFAFYEMKCVVEPGGAVALAALLSGKMDCANKTVAVVLSGGNIDPAVMSRAVADYRTA